MDKAIEQFDAAKLALKEATNALDEAVTAELVKITLKLDPNAPNKKELLQQRIYDLRELLDIYDLRELLDKLPDSYPGCRKIIEDIIRSEDFLNPDNKGNWPFA